jgi:hydrogenase nickel incorporation protein HypA/HybF
MHELAITENIVAVATGASANRQVKIITLKIGELAGVEQEAVRFCFGIVSKGTIAEGARLEIIRIPAIIRCRKCSTDFHLNDDWSCPVCAAIGGDVQGGREFFIESIEVEEEGEDCTVG